MKILIVTKNWLGDILFELPAIEMIHGRYPRAEIVCIAPERCREILEAHPAVSRVLAFDEKMTHRSFLSRLSFLFRLRRERAEKAFLFQRSKSRAFMLWAAGVPERTGYEHKRKIFLTHPVKEPNEPMHHVDYFVQMLVGAGFPKPDNPAYRFHFTAADHLSAQRLLKEKGLSHYVCFHLGANWEPKRWPPAHFARLADLISEKSGFQIVLTGASRDGALAAEVLKKTSKARCVSLIGETSLGQLGAIFRRACFVVSGDSGPMHIASGSGAKVLALFGPTDPKLTGPRGIGESAVLTYVPEGFHTPFFGENPPADWLAHISPEAVMAELEKRGWIKNPAEEEIAFPDERSGEPVRKTEILVITLTNIGDVIATTPVISSLAARFPGANISVVVSPRAREILSQSRKIDRLILYDKRASMKQKLEFLKQVRSRRYDYVIDLKNSAVPFLVSARRRSPVFRRFKKLRLRERHLEILEMMGLDGVYPSGFDFFNQGDRLRVDEKLRRHGIGEEEALIAVAPVAASGLKTWRLEGFKKVIAHLAENREEKIILLGAPQDKDPIQTLADAFPGRVFNFAGETSLSEVAALISRCALVLANDSAIMHLAFESRIPAVGIFGPTDPSKSGYESPAFRNVIAKVPCAPCGSPRCRFERQSCFEDLSPAEVLQACLELLEQARGAKRLVLKGGVR